MAENTDLNNKDLRENLKTLDNGIVMYEKEGHYFISVMDTELEVSSDDYKIIEKCPDYAFNVVIHAKRKYWFNTAMDRYSPTES